MAERLPRLFMIRVELQDLRELLTILVAQPLLAAPLGQLPMGVDRVGCGAGPPLVLDLRRRLRHHAGNFGSGNGHATAAGRGDDVARCVLDRRRWRSHRECCRRS